MSPFLARWFGSPDAKRVAALEAEAERLRQELAENLWLMNQWREEMTRTRAGFSHHIDDAVSDRVGQLLAELAPMLASIQGLAHDPNAWLAADMNDVNAWVARTEQVLSKFGVETLAATGDRTTFDVALHECVAGRAVAGDPVRVLTPALAYHGKILVKAAVKAAG